MADESSSVNNQSSYTDQYSNPLFLSPGENLSVPITSVKLSNDNYHLWSRSINVALSIKNKIVFIDGSLPPPATTDTTFAAWNRCNYAVLSWLLNSVSDDIAQSLISYDSAFITQYFTNLKMLWEEYLQYRPIPCCDFASGQSTTCTVAKQVLVYQEQDYSIRFIRGLNEAFDVVRSQLLLMDPLPDILTAFKCAVQLERQMKGVLPVQSMESMAMATGYNARAKAAVKGLFCRYCKKDNHVIENCYRLKNKKARETAGSSTSRDNGFAGLTVFDTNALDDSVMPQSIAPTESGRPSTGGQVSMAPMFFSPEEITRLRLLLQQSVASTSANSIPNDPNTSSHGTFILSSLPSLVSSLTLHSWILDTGASDHITCNLSNFASYHSISNTHITLPTGSHASATHIGTIVLDCGLTLTNVLYIPDFSFNLLSISRITHDLPITFIFSGDQCLIQDQTSQKKIGLTKVHRGLYSLYSPSLNPKSSMSSNLSFAGSVQLNFQPHSLDLWHCRLGHPSQSRIQLIHNSHPQVSASHVSHCQPCHLAKQRCLPFPISTSHAQSPFELVHMDIWGPLAMPTHDGFSYFLTILDDCTRCLWIYLMKNKSDTRFLVESFCHLVSNQHNTTVKTIRTDQGPEFAMTSFFASHGILHQVSCVATAQQNGRVERKHQHLLAVARALRFQSGLPLKFWGECILHACYLINRIPTPLLNNQSPFQILHHITPDYSNLRIFGCLTYASTLSHNRTKFQPRSSPCIFLGFRPGVKGFKLYDLTNHKIILSRNVHFHENILPFKTSAPVAVYDTFTSPPSSSIILPHIPTSSSDFFLDNSNSSSSVHNPSPPLNHSSSPPISTFISEPVSFNNGPVSPVDSLVIDSPTVSPLTTEPLQNPLPPTRISCRNRKPPGYLADYHCNLLLPSSPKPFVFNTNKFSFTNYLSYDHLSPSYKHFILQVSSVPEPKTYSQAASSDCWKQAMSEELQALENNRTWIITDLPPGKRPIGCKWVYRIKHHPDGSIDRYKARLVAKGFTQVYGIDFTDTFSPVAKINSVKALLAVSAIKHWHVHQMDVSNAFLHGDLEEEVYMTLPPGISTSSSTKPQVCKLLKSLYGLKQASRRWFVKLTDALKFEGFKQSGADHSVFTYTTAAAIVVLLVYVDDILLAGNDLTVIEGVKQKLHKHFKIKDLGILKYFLGLEIARTKSGIFMTQRKYCLELIEEAGFLDAKPTVIPADYKLKLALDGGIPLQDATEYQQIIGRLHYLTITRPDICYAVQQLSQFQANPTDLHLQAAHKVVRYLKGSPGQGLLFSSSSSLQLSGYSDSDWASCPDTRRSTSGYCVFLGSSLISWKSKKQSTVSRSSSEAEYRALAHLCCEVQWLVGLLKDFGIIITSPTRLFCDNQSAIHIANNPVFHERTKHIEIDCHVVRERLQAGLISLTHVPTDLQLADVFTKGLPAHRLQFLISKLGLHSIYNPA
ncbi:Retrovirus-related Pol polyprotein from transposon TNT 1-94 [Linum perenne]